LISQEFNKGVEDLFDIKSYNVILEMQKQA